MLDEPAQFRAQLRAEPGSRRRALVNQARRHLGEQGSLTGTDPGLEIIVCKGVAIAHALGARLAARRE